MKLSLIKTIFFIAFYHMWLLPLTHNLKLQNRALNISRIVYLVFSRLARFLPCRLYLSKNIGSESNFSLGFFPWSHLLFNPLTLVIHFCFSMAKVSWFGIFSFLYKLLIRYKAYIPYTPIYNLMSKFISKFPPQ